MRMAPLLAPALVTACSSGGSNLPEQDAAAVAANFVSVIIACSARLTTDGDIDEAALDAAGYTAGERKSGTGYRSSTWQSASMKGQIELVDYDDLADTCSLDARAAGADGAKRVRDALAETLGAPARQGAMPQGGDQLTPRATEDKTGYYWHFPRHDIYLTDFDGQSVRIEVVAMPDRDALDQYSPDRPEARIIAEDPIE